MEGFINEYKGVAIASEKSYVCFKKGICAHVKYIKLFGYMSETPGEVDLVLDVRFNSGYYKSFKIEKTEDGSWPEDGLLNALNEADKYLDSIDTENIPEYILKSQLINIEDANKHR